MRLAILLTILLLSASIAYADTTKTVWIINCAVGKSLGSPVNCQGASKSGWSGGGPFSTYAQAAGITVNQCAISGTVTGGTIDDKGSLNIGGSGFTDNTNGEDCPSTIHSGSGTFDPRTASISYNVNNGGGGEAEICAQVSVTFASNNGYNWDGTNCIDVAKISSIAVSNPTPLEDEAITVTCAAQAQTSAITLTFNGNSYTPTWQGNNAVFTVNVSGPGLKTASCMARGVEQQSATVDVQERILAPVANLAGTSFTCDESVNASIVNLTWDVHPRADHYYIYADGVLLANTTKVNFSSNTKNATVRNFLGPSTTHTWTVSGVRNGREGIPTNITVLNYNCDPLKKFYLPSRFHHAYFAQKGNKRIVSYWNENGMVMVYDNFTTDFSTLTPPGGKYYAGVGGRQLINLPVDQDEQTLGIWRQYTIGIKP